MDLALQRIVDARPAAAPNAPAPTVEQVRLDHSAQVEQYSPERTRQAADREDRAGRGRDGATIPIRIYRPATGSAGQLPTVLWIHGGGWVSGDLDTADPAARELAAAGAVVVAVDYRRAPEHRFPTAVDDCLDAMSWVADHIGELGADRSALGVAGDSAGGNLAAVVAQQPQWRGGALAAQLLVYPMMDARPGAGPYPSRARGDEHPFFTLPAIALSSRLYLEGAGDVTDALASPILAPDLSGVAPAVIVSVGHDPLQDEDFDYAQRLAAAGVPVTHLDEPALAHGAVDLMGSVPAARELFDRAIADFLGLLHAAGRD
ncbi:alpha/beta hydrolase [Flexivirga sp. ID2601S]|uniref:Alpha/beta hydrolase n=1 Tax=Flexivirga aerilata TaxID=1656889 RepID=A0A849ADW4_9MICO|nr:alpha/beta hydrolase [Flexivirga aerilata]NNG37963.1 alpha/beta hydrolase [Flexivirga aerilata]